VAKHGTARDDRRPTVGDLRTLRGNRRPGPASMRGDAIDRLITSVCDSERRARLGQRFTQFQRPQETDEDDRRNLSVPCAEKLEEAEYITCTKSFEGGCRRRSIG